jgi:glycosyltransferase involved in cell wall biosynthesis
VCAGLRREARLKRIALVIPGLDRLAGAERQIILLAKGLNRRGWRVNMVALTGTGTAAAAELASDGIAFMSLGMRHGLADPQGWIRFGRWLRSEKPDVIHAHLPHAAWLARWTRFGLVAGLGGSRFNELAPAVVDTLHSSSTGSWGRRMGYRFSRMLPDQVTAVSEAAAGAHRLAGMVNPRKLCVIPNGVDVEDWRPDARIRARVRAQLGITEEFLWLAAGRLEAVKDYPALLAAMIRLPKSVQLVIAGDGPLRDELTTLAARLGLDERVSFLGFEADLKRWMQAADAFVLSSRWEGLPMGLLEAGACALPSVATDVPGTREVIVDGVTGRLTPMGDANALAKAMGAMMELAAGERMAMGERARQRIVEKFSIESVLDRWETLYDDLLSLRMREV